MESYLVAFVSIFVAVDPIGNIPIFISLIEGKGRKQVRKIIADSVTTAAVMAVVFMVLGKWVLRLIGITIADFQIAGGLLLFVLSVRLLLPGGKKILFTNGSDKSVGVFPMGMPLITGPAVLTTLLIILDSYGIMVAFAALITNMFIVWLTLIKAENIMRMFKEAGIRAFSKIMYILLASLGVMMVRLGFFNIVGSVQ